MNPVNTPTSAPVITTWQEAIVAIVVVIVIGWVITTFIKALK